MAYKDEDETILILNEGDKKEGFFRFSTTKFIDFERLCRRVGGVENLLEVRTSTEGKRVISWVCKVPFKFIVINSWKVGKRRVVTVNNLKRSVTV